MATSTSTLVGNLIILNLAPNGTSTNFGEWCYGVEKHLLSSELKGICLKDILLNRGKGKMPLPPDPLGEGATATAKLAFDAKTTKYETDFSLWEQADAAVIRVFITTTPAELIKSYHTFRSAHDIWKYLQDRFHDKTAVGVAILIPCMFQMRLEECPGMADYISEIRNIHEELKDIGITFPEQAPAAGLLVRLTPAYNLTSSMLKQLPTKELTFERVASALLSAEKDLAAQASVNVVRYSPGIPFRSQQSHWRNSFPPCQYLIRKGPLYVDDMILVTKDQTELAAVKTALGEKLAMKDLGKLTNYPGMEITRDRTARTITLSQKFYINNVLTRFGLSSQCPVSPPGRFTSHHWSAAKRVLRYLKGTQDYVLTLRGSSPIRLEGYIDSSYADDQSDRRSSQGYCFTLDRGVVSWRSTRSSCVSLSTCEAELYAGTMAAQEARWLSFLQTELGYPQPAPTLSCDNESTIHLTNGPVFHARTKHIEVRHYFLREMVQRKQPKAEHIASDCNLDNLFTKSLVRQDHYRLLSSMGVGPPCG
ncbi:unnamed protein product [Closterium sp. NIES-54]